MLFVWDDPQSILAPAACFNVVVVFRCSAACDVQSTACRGGQGASPGATALTLC
jgi:hypothetical protein